MAIKILLADDSLTIQKVVELTFSDAETRLMAVGSGDRAVLALDEFQPDVVLADVVMPGLTGYEVCEAVKQRSGGAFRPVVLLTGTFEPFDRARAERVGADAIVTKPFDSHALQGLVRELVGKARSAREEAAAAPAEAPGVEEPLPTGGLSAADLEEPAAPPPVDTASTLVLTPLDLAQAPAPFAEAAAAAPAGESIYATMAMKLPTPAELAASEPVPFELAEPAAPLPETAVPPRAALTAEALPFEPEAAPAEPEASPFLEEPPVEVAGEPGPAEPAFLEEPPPMESPALEVELAPPPPVEVPVAVPPPPPPPPAFRFAEPPPPPPPPPPFFEPEPSLDTAPVPAPSEVSAEEPFFEEPAAEAVLEPPRSAEAPFELEVELGAEPGPVEIEAEAGSVERLPAVAETAVAPVIETEPTPTEAAPEPAAALGEPVPVAETVAEPFPEMEAPVEEPAPWDEGPAPDLAAPPEEAAQDVEAEPAEPVTRDLVADMEAFEASGRVKRRPEIWERHAALIGEEVPSDIDVPGAAPEPQAPPGPEEPVPSELEAIAAAARLEDLSKLIPAGAAAEEEILVAAPAEEPPPVTAPAPLAAAPAAWALSDSDVDRIARRVVELLSDKAVRDLAWEVVPETAERLVRERIAEVERAG